MLAKADGGTLRVGLSWAYEYKLDGYRAAMRVAADGTTMLTSRNGLDFTEEFPDLRDLRGGELPGRAVFDGEIVVYDEAGRVDFGLLQRRRGRFQTHRASQRRGQRFDDATPVRYLAFDLLQLGDRVLLAEPYDERRRLLESLPMPDPYRMAVVPAVAFEQLAADRLSPHQLLQRAATEGHEGLVAKLRSSPYLPGKRPEFWLKHPLVQTQEVIVCGWRPGQRGFTGRLGGLLLGAHDPNGAGIVYLGDVGTGFTERERADLQARLEAIERPQHPFAEEPPRQDVARARWVEPALVGEVRYRQFTRAPSRLRHTSWRGVRADRDPADITAPTPRDAATTSGEATVAATQPNAPAAPPAAGAGRAASRVVVQVEDRRLTLSNLDKVLYPRAGFTKGEVINYYSRVAPVLLPHLRGRPITFVRFPDGVSGQRFFEKNVARGAPSWLPTVVLPSSGSRGGGDSITYPLIGDLPALVWAANLAALELHTPQWAIGPDGARRPPDRVVFDLDPGDGSTIVDCCRVAERLHDLLADHGLTPVATTSGSKGMQVYAGIRTDDSRAPSAYAKTLAEHLATETPDLVVAKMAKALRAGKVFIDWSQNNPAKTTIAPYSLRGRDHPTIATPITWNEVHSCQHPDHLTFTADQVLDRIRDSGDRFEPTKRHAPLPNGRSARHNG